MKKFAKIILGCAGALALSASAASAAVVCNEDGDCWRTKTKYDYKPEFGVRVYSDDWRWDDSEKDRYRWREAREERGYWSKGVWIDF